MHRCCPPTTTPQRPRQDEVVTSAFPIYRTPNGTMVRAYVAEAMGQVVSHDGGAHNVRGKHGVIGSYATAEEAIAAAMHAKNETCTVQVINTRADDDAQIVIYTA